MMNLIMLNLILLMIPMLIILINKFMSTMKFQNREKMLPFECGFDPITESRTPFSIKFFMITLIFLIFDLEIIFMMPLIFMVKLYCSKWTIMFILFFLLLLTLGLVIEWKLKYLEWIN